MNVEGSPGVYQELYVLQEEQVNEIQSSTNVEGQKSE
jgi:hypothetical protein